jgi:hypothetical protein
MKSWAVVFLGICIVLAAFLMHGRFRVVSGSGNRIYVVDQFTGAAKLCTPTPCRLITGQDSASALVEAEKKLNDILKQAEPTSGTDQEPVFGGQSTPGQ